MTEPPISLPQSDTDLTESVAAVIMTISETALTELPPVMTDLTEPPPIIMTISDTDLTELPPIMTDLTEPPPIIMTISDTDLTELPPVMTLI